jgi:hypothetical protein
MMGDGFTGIGLAFVASFVVAIVMLWLSCMKEGRTNEDCREFERI